MPWLYAFHATGVVSLPHFNFLHSNFYLVLSHNHKCFGVSHATFIREKPNHPVVGMHSGRSAVGLSLSAENSHKARETMAASERGSAERNTTRRGRCCMPPRKKQIHLSLTLFFFDLVGILLPTPLERDP